MAVLGVSGLLFSVASAPIFPGLAHGLLGALVGLAIWLPSYVVRQLGAGDVKLFAAAGAWLGPHATLESAILAALAGGVLALVWMLRLRGAEGTAASLMAARIDPKSLFGARPSPGQRHHLPYSLAMTAGCVVGAWYPHLLF